ncbi:MULTISPECIES: PDR/VanB family oxidoreductase [Pseudomonas]|uniref:PDR/VanB family oxidoreductase n=1 Tax=Pseudomonas TaxID=286 RepID=UPI001E2C34BB|nr:MULTISPECIES: PDR/VanB family oxidoreductase [Pseudomonas]MCE1117333.1 PDR/VanB family oxidoreductase [Pseudomonas sp. NMI795_08]
MPDEALTLQITDLIAEAKGVMVIELRAPDGAMLPAFSAGAHIELHLPGAIVRQYSLCNDPRERHRYCVGVGLSPTSRGGSRHVHQSLRVGDTLRVSPPRNNFAMEQDAAGFVFFAGGIGITPIWSMIQWCEANQRPWHLFYLVRSRQRAAFLEALRGFGDKVTLHADDEAGGLFDIASAINRQAPNVHFYTCGPTPLMLAVEAAARGFPEVQVHFEWFTPKAQNGPASNKAFTVQLARSGQRLEVPADRSILQVLEAHGLRVESSCREGTCASCEICVLDGTPEHRDSVLSPAERKANDVMMICVSRALSDTLVLDL